MKQTCENSSCYYETFDFDSLVLVDSRVKQIDEPMHSLFDQLTCDDSDTEVEM